MRHFKFLLFIHFLGLLSNIYAQNNVANNQAKGILQKTLEKLENSHVLSYDYLKEFRYFEDNYDYKASGYLYFEKEKKSVIDYKFIGTTEKKGKYVFNGKDSYSLNEELKTITTDTFKNAKQLNANSYLFHSAIMLQKLISLLLVNDTLINGISDTIINKKSYYNILIEGNQLYFGTRSAEVNTYKDADLRRPYLLIIDKKTFLPYQFIAKIIKGISNKDYMRLTYTNINLKTKKLPANTWQYDNYSALYKIPEAQKEITTIKVGAKLPYFSMPTYEPTKIDSFTLNNLLGKTTLIDFWFKSCGPCMVSMPLLNDFKAKFNPEKFNLISINVEDGILDMDFFYKKLKPTFKMLYNGKSWYNNQLGLSACPTAILVNETGTILNIWSGFNKEKMETRINEVLKEN